MIRAHVREVLVVPERVVEEAIALLAEGAKLVAEGAGAAGVAALLAYPERFAGRARRHAGLRRQYRARILANVLLRNLLRDGRLLRAASWRSPIGPGVLADIAAKIGNSGGNIIDVSHHRLFAAPSVQAARAGGDGGGARRRAWCCHRDLARGKLHRSPRLEAWAHGTEDAADGCSRHCL